MTSREVGGSVPLLGLAQAGGDAIPREYHRKVLKKIAQLTKNDENEQLIARLKATHEEDLDRILSDCTHRLEQCKDKLSIDYKQAEKKVTDLTQALAAMKKERNDLLQERASYKKTAEESLMTIKTQHAEKLLSLTTELEQFRKDQDKQLKDFTEYRNEMSKHSSQKIEELEQSYREKMAELQKILSDTLSQERDSLVEKHEREVASLKRGFEEQMKMKKHQLEMSESHSESVATEKKLSEERENALRQELSQKEEQLSSLSADLRTTKDKLALSQQKVADLLSKCQHSQTSSEETTSRLKEAQEELERLRVALRETKNELEISREHYQQQLSEMKKMSAQAGKLEALAVSKEGVIGELQSQVSSLQVKLSELEEEKSALESSRTSISEQQLAQITALRMEFDKMRKQKEGMRVQYAREIEAAQAQLGEREAALGYEHLQALQHLRDENEKAILEAKREKDASLYELQKRLECEREEDLEKLRQRLESEKGQLSTLLADKTAELELAQEQLKRLESELLKKEQGMGSAASSLERLKMELMSTRGEMVVLQREKEGMMKERERLLSAVEGLKERGRELSRTHQDQLDKLKKSLTQELETKWKEKVKIECGLLREELASRYEEDSKVALAELADLKDKGFENARKKWEAERGRLSMQVSELERKLMEAQKSSSEKLEEAMHSSSGQIAALKHKLEKQRAQSDDFTAELKLSHQQKLDVLREACEAEKEGLITALTESHNVEKLELHKANQLATEALRERLEQQSLHKLERARLEHDRDMVDQRAELMSEHEREKESLQEAHRILTQRQQEEMKRAVNEQKKEVTHHERMTGRLKSALEERDAELSTLRNKVSSLTVGVSNLRKELEVKGQEVLAVRREANTIFQQRLHEVSTAHNKEVESLTTQHKHQSQLLLADFNKAKAIFANKISYLEAQVSEWETRYKSRDSKPEDLEQIRELTSLTQQQKLKIKDLIAEKRVYQLEMINREKNYNQIFNANPSVGVLNPLASKKKHESGLCGRYLSAPSLMPPTPPPSDDRHHHPHPTPLSSMSGPLLPVHPHITTTTTTTTHTTHSTSASQLFSRRDQPLQRQQQQAPPPPSPTPPKPRRIVTLKDSPLNTRHKAHAPKSERNGAEAGVGHGDGMGPLMKPLEPIPPLSGSAQKHMIVQ